MDIIGQLPHYDIVFPKVFCHLSIKELFLLRLLSKHYCNLVSEYFVRSQRLDLSKICKKADGKAFKLMTDGNTVLQHLLIPNTSYWLTDDLLIPVVSRCKFLTHVDLSNNSQLSSNSLCTLSQCCHLLTLISLRGCHWVDDTNFKQLVCNNPRLLEIDVTSCWSLNDTSIIYCVECCPKIRSLKLSDIYSITNEALRAVASSCPNLSTLAVRGCWRVTNDGIRVIGEYCSKLSELCVSECRDVTEASLARLRVRKVSIDVPAVPLESLRRLGRTFEYALPYLNLQI